jgi:hypothetical protein
MSTEPDDLKHFTRALAGVPPHQGLLDRDALLFAAGRASGRRSAMWPATAAGLAILSGALAVALMIRSPTIVEVERTVYVPIPETRDKPGPDPAVAPEDIPASSHMPETTESGSLSLVEGLRQRQRVLADGVGALPQTPWAVSTPSPDDVPDLSSLRLNASHPDGERFQ